MPNIIYFTTECNFDCDYCYERKSRSKLKSPIIPTKKELENIVDKIIEDNNGNLSLTLFGGEPLLELDLIKYVLDYCKIKYGKPFPCCLVTNGVLLKNKDTYDYIVDKINNETLKLEISYDVSGQFRRKYKNGNPSNEDVVFIMNKLNTDNIPFWISYVLNKDTYNNAIKDFIYMFETYKNLAGIVVSLYRTELDMATGGNEQTNEFLKKFKILCLHLYKHFYHKPICDQTCALCKKCNKVDDKFNNYYIKNDKQSYEVRKNMGEFKQW